MKDIVKYLIIGLCIFSLTSCFRDRIDLDLKNEENKKLVVDAWLTNADEQQKVRLYYTRDYLTPALPETINDAKVTLSYAAESIDLVLESNGTYLLPSDWRAQEEVEYHLRIEHEGEEYTSTSMMSAMPELEEIFFLPVEEDEDGTLYYGLFFSFQETEGKGNGYYGVDYMKNTQHGDTLINGGFIHDEFIDGQFISSAGIETFEYLPGDSVVLDVFSIGRDAADFLQDIISEAYRAGVFDPPPVNVRSNISNGAVGYFITSGTRRYEGVVE